jgi:hypothetical protein
MGELFSPSYLSPSVRCWREGVRKFLAFRVLKKVGVSPNLAGILRLLFDWIKDLLLPPYHQSGFDVSHGPKGYRSVKLISMVCVLVMHGM